MLLEGEIGGDGGVRRAGLGGLDPLAEGVIVEAQAFGDRAHGVPQGDYLLDGTALGLVGIDPLTHRDTPWPRQL